MSRYADLNVKCSKKTANEVISALRVFPYETMGSGRWEIAVEAMERSASMALDPFIYWNYRQKKGGEIYALLALFYSPGEYSLDIMGTILFKPYQDLGEGLFFDN